MSCLAILIKRDKEESSEVSSSGVHGRIYFITKKNKTTLLGLDKNMVASKASAQSRTTKGSYVVIFCGRFLFF